MSIELQTESDFSLFRDRFAALLRPLGPDTVASHTFFQITPRDTPWMSSGLSVEAGQSVSFFVGGFWYLAEALNLTLEPGFVFWARAGQKGKLYSPPGNSGTHAFTSTGELLLARSAGEWASDAGDLLVPPEIYHDTKGHVFGVAIVWNRAPAEGLSALLQAGDVDGLVEAELRRLRADVSAPRSWSYYPLLGNRETFHHCDHGKGICCHTDNNVGILQYPVDVPLVEGTRLDWRWVVDSLPSAVAEDTLPTHDYLSIAVEFDDGQDLTYLWSVELPVGAVFRCPIPTWTARETHLVVRSGLSELGQSVAEHRDIFADYHTHIGGDATRVVSVWLIAVSLFQHGAGQCRYQEITLNSIDGRVEVIAGENEVAA